MAVEGTRLYSELAASKLVHVTLVTMREKGPGTKKRGGAVMK